MKNILIGTILSAIATFMFGAVFWMNPLAKNAFLSPKDDVAVQNVVKEQFPRSGSYTIPDFRQPEEEFHKKAEGGPVAIVHMVEKGGPSTMGATMVKGFVSQLFAMFVLGLLLNSCLAALPTYGTRVRFCALVGLVGAVFIDTGNMVWWHQSVPFTLFTGVYHFISCVLAGLVLAKFVRPAEERSAITQASNS